jgi:hypothetical protein
MNTSNLSKEKKKGKILSVKTGYNPNSSSMGSIVFILPASLLALTVGFGVISGIIISTFMRKSDKKTKEEKQV